MVNLGLKGLRGFRLHLDDKDTDHAFVVKRSVSLHLYLPSLDFSDIASCEATPSLWESTASRPVLV